MSNNKQKGVFDPPEPIENLWLKYECEIFRTTVFLYVGTIKVMMDSMDDAVRRAGFNKDTSEEICNFMEERISLYGDQTNAGDCFHISTKHHGEFYLIRLSSFTPGDVEDILVLNHECLHAAIRHLDVVGIRERDNSSHECLCYFHEDIVRSFIKQLHRGHLA